MRTIVDIPNDLIVPLTKLAKKKKTSRSHLIREALRELIAAAENTVIKDPDAAFGSWSSSKVDGLAYQKKLRKEWE